MSLTVNSLALSVLVVLSIVLAASAVPPPPGPAGGRSDNGVVPSRRMLDFHKVGCLGELDISMFAKLNQVCQSCYELYRDPKLLHQCADKCFTALEFKGCVDALMETDRIPEYQGYIKFLHRPLNPF